jgi:hypothetical protein
MNRPLLIAAFVCCGTAIASASPSASFGDRGFASTGLDAATNGSDSILILDELFSDSPVVMLSENPSPAGDLSRRIAPKDLRGPGFFGSFDSTKGGSDGSQSKGLPGSPLVPLPAPAGLAIAGLLFIGSVRRR